MTTMLRHYRKDGTVEPDFDQCPVEIPSWWTGLVGDYCGLTEFGKTCWHNGTCPECYRCPCHCKCQPPAPKRVYTQYELDFMEQSKHYYDSGRD